MAYDLIVVGSGAAGMTAAIKAARDGKRVLLLEKLSKIGTKLKATGGGRCNLTNRLDRESFMQSFGRHGRFMSPALALLDQQKLRDFFEAIGVQSHAPDGFRVFPITHSSNTIIDALAEEMDHCAVTVRKSQRVTALKCSEGSIVGVETQMQSYNAPNVIIATGGMGYPTLGAEGDGYRLAKAASHTTTPLYPAMMPLKTKEQWVAECRADTIAKVKLVVDIKKYRKLQAVGDLIFTKDGIRGPVVLDFSREITPLLSKLDTVPLLMNLTQGRNQEQIRLHIKEQLSKNPHRDTLTMLQSLLPISLSLVLCKMADIDPYQGFTRQAGVARDRLIELLAWTPLTIIGHDGFKMAMITRGGISLKEIDPNTMQSKKCRGLYFCGEVVDLDGPCGGYNLQWSFASGYLAGSLF